MVPGELENLPSQPPDRRIAYGNDTSHFGELRVPSGPGPHPVAVLIHGGCFKAAYATRRDLEAMGDALKTAGIATWNIEYRRLGQPGGGWPGTYLDVANAVDYLRVLATHYPLDLSRVVLVGHSAGGHLAAWAAARTRVPAGSAIHTIDPFRVRGVVDLAGPLDLTANIPEYEAECHDSVITQLLGGPPTMVPDRYADASPQHLLPVGVPQMVLLAQYDKLIPQSAGEAYVKAALQAGDSVRLMVIPNIGHFELANPRATSWSHVEAAIRSLLDGRLPP
jgi:acetyl esterase/lipase